MAFGSFEIALATSPSEVTGLTFVDCVLPLSTACWKNVYVPAVESRPTGSIVVVRPAPGTWPQLVSVPRKMSPSWVMLGLLRLLALLTSMQRPSRNAWRYVVPESLGSGGRVLT